MATYTAEDITNIIFQRPDRVTTHIADKAFRTSRKTLKALKALYSDPSKAEKPKKNSLLCAQAELLDLGFQPDTVCTITAGWKMVSEDFFADKAASILQKKSDTDPVLSASQSFNLQAHLGWRKIKIGGEDILKHQAVKDGLYQTFVEALREQAQRQPALLNTDLTPN